MFGIKKNVGSSDRVARVIIGAVLTAAGYLWLMGWQSIVAYVLGAGTFATGAIGFCSVYKLLGISTAKCESCAEGGHEIPPNSPQAPMV